MEYPGLIKKGSTNEEAVKAIKKRLNEFGHKFKLSNPNFLSSTEKGVKQFQSDYGLEPDGIVGRKTWDKLFNMDTEIEPQGATTISEKGLAIIKQFEGLVLHAYKDVVGVTTIGWGTTRYESGQPVRMGEVITKVRAEQLLKFEATAKSFAIAEALGKVALNQNQFDAVVSLAYNIGVAGFVGSTILRRIKANTTDPAIRDAFMMWIKGPKSGKKVVLSALVDRRKKEADLYFS